MPIMLIMLEMVTENMIDNIMLYICDHKAFPITENLVSYFN